MSNESKRAVVLRHFLTGRAVSFGAGRRPAREGGDRRGLRHEGRMWRVRRKGKERVVGKAAGDEHVLKLAEALAGR